LVVVEQARLERAKGPQRARPQGTPGIIHDQALS